MTSICFCRLASQPAAGSSQFKLGEIIHFKRKVRSNCSSNFFRFPATSTRRFMLEMLRGKRIPSPTRRLMFSADKTWPVINLRPTRPKAKSRL
jgi:hypothetical protein